MLASRSKSTEAYNLTFYASHHEALLSAYQIVFNHGIGTTGVTITDSYFRWERGSQWR